MWLALSIINAHHWHLGWHDTWLVSFWSYSRLHRHLWSNLAITGRSLELMEGRLELLLQGCGVFIKVWLSVLGHVVNFLLSPIGRLRKQPLVCCWFCCWRIVMLLLGLLRLGSNIAVWRTVAWVILVLPFFKFAGRHIFRSWAGRRNILRCIQISLRIIISGLRPGVSGTVGRGTG